MVVAYKDKGEVKWVDLFGTEEDDVIFNGTLIKNKGLVFQLLSGTEGDYWKLHSTLYRIDLFGKLVWKSSFAPLLGTGKFRQELGYGPPSILATKDGILVSGGLFHSAKLRIEGSLCERDVSQFSGDGMMVLVDPDTGKCKGFRRFFTADKNQDTYTAEPSAVFEKNDALYLTGFTLGKGTLEKTKIDSYSAFFVMEYNKRCLLKALTK